MALINRSILDAINNSTTPGRDRHHHLKIAGIHNQQISDLVPFSGLILTCWMALLVLITHYVFQPLFVSRSPFLQHALFLGKRLAWNERIFSHRASFARTSIERKLTAGQLRYYRRIYLDLDMEKRRSLMNHHIGGAIKVVLLIVGAYPWVHVLFVGAEDFDTPMAKGSRVQMGDILLILTQLFIAMYVYELVWRIKLSPIAMAHHIGAIIIAQVAVALSLRLEKEKAATFEYMLCLVWGAFDVLAEMWPNFAMIIYRTHKDNHYLLKNVFLVTSLITLMGTTAETILTFVFLASIWTRIDMAFKILTPILYMVFVLAQLHGSKILYIMYKKECRKLVEIGDAETIGIGVLPKGVKVEDSPPPTAAAAS
jgi:hypothetical protein